MGKVTYVSIPLLELSSDRALPCDIYLCLHHKMVKYRNSEDKLDPEAFNKLVFNRVKFVFVDEKDRQAVEKYMEDVEEHATPEEKALHDNPDTAPIAEAVQETRRAMMDIFESPRDDAQVKKAIDTSKRMVSEFLRKPFAVNNIQALQKYGRGAVDHSVNVSVLSVFLGLRMGLSHQVILENLAMGGLLHDVGKILIEPQSELMGAENPAMQDHPKLGRELLAEREDVSNEVRLIVGQHHEFLDGSGYPAKLKGLAVYDLARLVAIANIYDNLVGESVLETMKERATEALNRLETEYEGKLDPKKLEKVLKILRYSFL